MNQEKIGKFIATCRKNSNLTQEQLAEKLGITYKAVSKWECGKGLPDASIMVDLCDILNITVNDLLSGENVSEDNYQKKLEENIIETMDYSNRQLNVKSKTISLLIMVIGIGVVFVAFSIFPSESSWGSIFSIIGIIISGFGLYNLSKKMALSKKVIICVGYVLLSFAVLVTVDYFNVALNKVPPRFSYLKETGDTMIIYRAPFYNVYRINRGTKNEYYIVDTKSIYTDETVPVSPFKRDKSGIDNIIKYKNKYVGNNSNDGNLIGSLPLAEYGYVFEIDSVNRGLTINYHVTDWYINEGHYLERALLYNTVAIFTLIGNVEKLTVNFSGRTYEVDRERVELLYPNFKNIGTDEINKENFNKYVENKMNDSEFVEVIFNAVFEG